VDRWWGVCVCGEGEGWVDGEDEDEGERSAASGGLASARKNARPLESQAIGARGLGCHARRPIKAPPRPEKELFKEGGERDHESRLRLLPAVTGLVIPAAVVT
jgi:hypothetical protein